MERGTAVANVVNERAVVVAADRVDEDPALLHIFFRATNMATAEEERRVQAHDVVKLPVRFEVISSAGIPHIHWN